MQFINIVVHSVEDMNFRVHLQFDFTKLGLDDYLDVSLLHSSQVLKKRSLGSRGSCYLFRSKAAHPLLPVQ